MNDQMVANLCWHCSFDKCNASKCTKDYVIVELLKRTDVDNTLVDAVVSEAVWNPDRDRISFITLH